jgi:hypothetical protein
MVKGTNIVLFERRDEDFLSVTDIARYKDPLRSDYILQNWMRSRNTIEFLGLWEKINNPDFNSIEFDGIKNQAGLNSFSLTPQRWIKTTSAIGIISQAGRYGGTYAHKDIAFEFASWISPEFKLFLIKEFQRLKEEENDRLKLGWDLKRNLARINYQIHTDAIKEHLIPEKISTKESAFVYATEADILNMALFGKTAAIWKSANKAQKGNMRDYANTSQLVCLANLESMNAEFIRQGLDQQTRLIKLNEIAIIQMKSLLKNSNMKWIEKS